MEVQKRIRQLMQEKGWSDYRLAKEAHLSQSTIANVFKRNNAPTLPTLESICRALGITLSQFFCGDAEPLDLTAEQFRLLKKWASLSDRQRKLLLELIQTM